MPDFEQKDFDEKLKKAKYNEKKHPGMKAFLKIFHDKYGKRTYWMPPAVTPLYRSLDIISSEEKKRFKDVIEYVYEFTQLNEPGKRPTSKTYRDSSLLSGFILKTLSGKEESFYENQLFIMSRTGIGKAFLTELKVHPGHIALKSHGRAHNTSVAYGESTNEAYYVLERRLHKNALFGKDGAESEVRKALRFAPKETRVTIGKYLQNGMPTVTLCDGQNRQITQLANIDPKNKTINEPGYRKLPPIDTANGATAKDWFKNLVLNTTAKSSTPVTKPTKKDPGWIILLICLRKWLTKGKGCKSSVELHTGAKHLHNLPFVIILFHELVHAYHQTVGTSYQNRIMEEAQTVGLFPFHNDAYTENKFRLQLNTLKSFTMPPRIHYYFNDAVADVPEQQITKDYSSMKI